MMRDIHGKELEVPSYLRTDRPRASLQCPVCKRTIRARPPRSDILALHPSCLEQAIELTRQFFKIKK